MFSETFRKHVFLIVFELRGPRRHQFRRGQDHGAPMVSTARITRLGVASRHRVIEEESAEWGGCGASLTCLRHRYRRNG